MKIVIFVDTRENAIIKELESYDCVIKRKMLDCGDFLCSERICVERKTKEDFLESIIDQRLFSQLKKMKENYDIPLLIIEGNSFSERLHPNSVYGALASITIDYSIPILWSVSSKETAGLIFTIARREQIDNKKQVVIRNRKPKTSLSKQQEFLISGLPSINSVLAKRLLNNFEKPMNVFSASEEDLKKVDGIGKRKAKKIFDLLDSKYK